MIRSREIRLSHNEKGEPVTDKAVQTRAKRSQLHDPKAVEMVEAIEVKHTHGLIAELLPGSLVLQTTDTTS
jgi:hypothetical protein